jgi:hypothetical protein
MPELEGDEDEDKEKEEEEEAEKGKAVDDGEVASSKIEEIS